MLYLKNEAVLLLLVFEITVNQSYIKYNIINSISIALHIRI